MTHQLTVIASEAKQSIAAHGTAGLLVAALRNDDRSPMTDNVLEIDNLVVGSARTATAR